MMSYDFFRRDRLVGSKDRDRFDAMISSVLASDWTTGSSDRKYEGYYVTWGARQEVTGRVKQ